MKTLLQISGLSKSYGPRVIFDNAEAVFSEGQKIGVIGRNGAGKTTLCRIITGHEEADAGQAFRHPELRLAYLEQGDPFRPGESAREFLMRYTGREEWRCGKVAGRFGIKKRAFEDVPVCEMPGGYQTRVKLCAMWLAEPNFLILDEPTNYLDLRTLILLEKMLLDFPGGYLVVSHDREFLKKTCAHTLEVENGDLFLYPGPVEEFLEFKEQQIEQAERVNRNIEIRRRELQAFVERFRAKASKAAQAQSKLKQLERLEKIEIVHPMRGVRIQIPEHPARRGIALECEDLAIGYGERRVAERINLLIERGAKVAVVGDNGQGKTTFLRTLACQIPGLGGRFRWGGELEAAYYAQHVYAALDPRQDVIGHMMQQAGPGVGTQQVLDMAGSFLFSGDDAYKKVAVLSGGERARTCLAGVLLGKKPVLLLDEPTNHLDFQTVEILGQALRAYSGTVFFVSHDRTFVNLVATAVAVVRDGAIVFYPGSYEDYVESMRREEEAEEPADGNGAEPGEVAEKADAPAKPLRRNNEINRLVRQLAEGEERIRRLETEKAELIREVSGAQAQYSRERYERLEEIVRLIEAEELRWIEAHERLDRLRNGG